MKRKARCTFFRYNRISSRRNATPYYGKTRMVCCHAWITHLRHFIGLIIITLLAGEQGWRSAKSTRLPPMWYGLKSRCQRDKWVEFPVSSLLCSERFFSDHFGFPVSSKTNISKFQFDQESGRRKTTMWMYYLQIVIYLFIIYLFIYFSQNNPSVI